MDSWLLLWWAVLMIWFIGSLFFYIFIYVGQILITVFCWSILSSLAQKRRYKSYVCSVLRRHLWITFCSCLNFLDMLLTTFCILNMYYLYYFRCMTYVKVFSLTLFSRYMNYVVILRLQYFKLKYFWSTCSTASIINRSVQQKSKYYTFDYWCWELLKMPAIKFFKLLKQPNTLWHDILNCK